MPREVLRVAPNWFRRGLLLLALVSAVLGTGLIPRDTRAAQTKQLWVAANNNMAVVSGYPSVGTYDVLPATLDGFAGTRQGLVYDTTSTGASRLSSGIRALAVDNSDTVYAFDYSHTSTHPRHLRTLDIDPDAGTVTSASEIGTGNACPEAGDFSDMTWHNGVLYAGFHTSSVIYVYTVDHTDGTCSVLTEDIGGHSSHHRIALASHGGTLYVARRTGSSNDLTYLTSLNTSTGAMTDIGTMPDSYPENLRSHDGVLYLLAGNLYTVNTSTAATTEVVSGGFNAGLNDVSHIFFHGDMPDRPATQDAASWEDDETRIIIPVEGAVTVPSESDTDNDRTICARWPDGDPQVLRLFNVNLDLYGVCIEFEDRSTDYYHLTIHLAPNQGTALERLEGLDILASFGVELWDDGVALGLGTYHVDWSTLDYGDDSLGATDTWSFKQRSRGGGDCRVLSADGAEEYTCPLELETFQKAAAGDFLNIVLGLSDTGGSKMTESGAPATFPTGVTAARSASRQVTVGWQMFEPVLEYEIERLEALSVQAGEAATVGYGNRMTFAVGGVTAGVDRYVDTSVEANTSYQYRVRGKRTAYGEWSGYALAVGQEPLDERRGVFTTPDLAGFSPGVDRDGSPTAHEIIISALSPTWPIGVAAIGGQAVRISADGTATGCSGLETGLTVKEASPAFWLYACEANGSAVIQLRRDSDQKFLAEYRVRTRSSRTPPPTPGDPGAIGVPSSDDPLGIEPIIQDVMRHTGIEYDMGLLKDFLVIAGAVGLAAVPLRKGGRGLSSVVIAFLVFNMALWLGALWMGFPWYWALIPTGLTVGLGIMAGARSVAGAGGGA